MESVMAEVDKGSERTAFVLGLVGPKGKISDFREELCSISWKGKRLKFLYWKPRTCGNTIEPELLGRVLGSVLFALWQHQSFESACLEKRMKRWYSNMLLHVIRCALPGLWNFRENLVLTSAVPYTASGLLGSKPLVDRLRRMREVGKLDLYLWKKDWLWGLSEWDLCIWGTASRCVFGCGWDVVLIMCKLISVDLLTIPANSELVRTRGIWLFN